MERRPGPDAAPGSRAAARRSGIGRRSARSPRRERQNMCTSSGSSRCNLRERSMFRHTLATTVVSQPPRFSMPLASDRPRRTRLPERRRRHRSPNRAFGRPPPADASRGPRTARPDIRVRPRSHSFVASCHSSDLRNPMHVTGGRNHGSRQKDRGSRGHREGRPPCRRAARGRGARRRVDVTFQWGGRDNRRGTVGRPRGRGVRHRRGNRAVARGAGRHGVLHHRGAEPARDRNGPA